MLVVSVENAMKEFRILDKVTDSFAKTGLKFDIFDGITPNPKTEEITKGVEIVKANGCQVIVGLGGGSALDAAKAIALAAGSGVSIEDYFWKSLDPQRALPTIAVPTTAGTGSELSRTAILTDTKNKIKKAIRGDALLPKVAIVDPELTLSVPPDVTAETGFDVLAHAIETYVSRRAQPITELFSERAIHIVSQNLARCVYHGSDLKARSAMSFASLLMGFNLVNSSNCLPHRLQYPVGALTDTSHGRGLAALYPTWMRRTYRYSPDKFARIASLMKKDVKGTTLTKAAEQGVEAVEELLRDIHLPIHLRDLGVKPTDSTFLASQVCGDLSADPGEAEEADIIDIYQKAM